VVIIVSKGPSPTPGAATVAVPNVIGQQQGDALTQLQTAGLVAQVFNDFSADVAKGRVIGQLPDFGKTAPAGSTAVLMVSRGPAEPAPTSTSLPNVVGLAEGEAASHLQAARLSPQAIHNHDPNVPAGTVVSQLPSAHSLAQIPAKRSLTWLWIALAGLILLALGAWWYMGQQNQSSIPIAAIVATDTAQATDTAEATAPAEAPAPTVTAVPSVIGMTEAEAETTLKDAGFTALATKVTTNDNPAGTVTAQVPDAGSELTPGSQVAIQVAQADEPPPPSSVKVPDVVGMTQADAQSALSKAGLVSSFVTQANSATKGDAFAQQPAAGQSVPPQSTVVVGISSGKPPAPESDTVAVPKVIGMTQADAVAAVAAVGLSSQVAQSYNAAPKGEVYQQWPPAGTMVSPSTPVAVLVSLGKAPEDGNSVTVPNVKGMSVDAATQALADAGLVAQPVTISDPSVPAGQVLGQLPASGSKVPAGSVVLIGVAGPGATQLPAPAE
jgi:beta-lactam-binding protein with PASTA domain